MSFHDGIVITEEDRILYYNNQMINIFKDKETGIDGSTEELSDKKENESFDNEAADSSRVEIIRKKNKEKKQQTEEDKSLLLQNCLNQSKIKKRQISVRSLKEGVDL
jgi:hypothetical protein